MKWSHRSKVCNQQFYAHFNTPNYKEKYIQLCIKTTTNTMIEVTIKLDEVTKQYISSELEALFEKYFMGITKHHKPQNDDAEVWLSLAQAKQILSISSRKKWKQLRDERRIDFAKVGRGFVYSSKSINDYLDAISSKRKTKVNRR
jgi:hypothetical protein